MTEFEEKYLEELKKQRKEYEDFNEGCHQYALALFAILGIGSLIILAIFLPCLF